MFRYLLPIILFVLAGSIFAGDRGGSVPANALHEIGLFAQGQGFDDVRDALGKRFSGNKTEADRSYGRWLLLIVVLTVVVLGGGATYYSKHYEKREKEGYDSPRELLRLLLKEHQVSRKEAKFLKNLAKELGLPDPLELFIEPKHLSWAFYNAKFADKTEMIGSLEKRFFGIETKIDDEARGFITSWLSGNVPAGLQSMMNTNPKHPDENDPDRTDIWERKQSDI